MTANLVTLLAERSCERLVIASARHNGVRDWTALARLYEPDARLVRPSGQVVDGRAAIEESYRGSPPDRRTRHVCTNIRVSVDGAATASADTVVLLYAWTETAETSESAGPTSGELPTAAAPVLGEFFDTFVCVDDEWMIASRHATLLAAPRI